MTYENKKGYLKPPANLHNDPFIDDLNSLFESLHEHDDRSMVLNVAAFAEDTLGLLLLAYLREPKQAKELVSGFNAPLGSFSSKIKAAFVLGLIHKDAYETLETLRKIRNEFAHNWQGVSLDRDDIKIKIDKLSSSRLENVDQSAADEQKPLGRDRLIIKIFDILIDIRSLAKHFTKSKVRSPLLAFSLKPVRAEILVVDRFPNES